MTILADQCINKDIIEAFRDKKLKIISASDVNLSTASDTKIFDYILKNKYTLLTFDKDFGNILRFNIPRSYGIIIIYIDNMNKQELIENTLNFFERFNKSQLKGKLFIIEKNKIRIWKH